MSLILLIKYLFLPSTLTSRGGSYICPNRCLRPYTHILFHLELELELPLESKLEFKLPRVVKAELLAGVAEDAAYCIQ